MHFTRATLLALAAFTASGSAASSDSASDFSILPMPTDGEAPPFPTMTGGASGFITRTRPAGTGPSGGFGHHHHHGTAPAGQGPRPHGTAPAGSFTPPAEGAPTDVVRRRQDGSFSFSLATGTPTGRFGGRPHGTGKPRRPHGTGRPQGTAPAGHGSRPMQSASDSELPPQPTESANVEKRQAEEPTSASSHAGGRRPHGTGFPGGFRGHGTAPAGSFPRPTGAPSGGFPGGAFPTGGFPGGAPSGVPSGGFPTDVPSGFPSDAPTDGFPSASATGVPQRA